MINMQCKAAQLSRLSTRPFDRVPINRRISCIDIEIWDSSPDCGDRHHPCIAQFTVLLKHVATTECRIPGYSRLTLPPKGELMSSSRMLIGASLLLACAVLPTNRAQSQSPKSGQD